MGWDETTAGFERMKDETGANDVAAALLVLAQGVTTGLTRIADRLKDFDHQICVGIRHGLFGTSIDHHTTLADEFTQVAEAMEGIQAAMSDIATAMEKPE